MILLFLVLLECLECNGSEITSPVILVDQKNLNIFLFKNIYTHDVCTKKKYI